VHVDDDGQIRGERLIQNGVDAREERGVDRVGRAGLRVTTEFDGNAHVIEAALRDERKVAGQHLATPVALVGCFEAIAQVDPFLEMPCSGRRLPEDEGIGTCQCGISVHRRVGDRSIAKPAAARRSATAARASLPNRHFALAPPVLCEPPRELEASLVPPVPASLSRLCRRQGHSMRPSSLQHHPS
jgi:hypothetical protein